MKPVLNELLDGLRKILGERIRNISDFRGDVLVVINKDAIVEAATFLRDNSICPFPLCVDVFGIDGYRRENRFEVNYLFRSFKGNTNITLKIFVDESDLHVPTITGVFPAADWAERETYDMYGIEFSGHPDLRRIYMTEDYEYFPLRKDFPLLGIPGSIPFPKR